jgi:hypothetical protein
MNIIMRHYIHMTTECIKQFHDNEVNHKDRDYGIVCNYAKTCRCPITSASSPDNLLCLHLDRQSLWDFRPQPYTKQAQLIWVQGVYSEEGKEQCCLSHHARSSRKAMATQGQPMKEIDHRNG